MSYEKDLVSIIIPCYNGENFIENNFRSIINQTYKKLEVVFVDDGSTDGSYEKAVKYIDLFQKEGIKLICLKKENGGAASAVDLALKTIKGEFFQLFDIDDYIYPKNIEDKYNYLTEYKDCAFVRNEGEIFNVEKNKVVSIFSARKKEKRTYNIFYDLLFGRTWNWPGSFLVRSETFFSVNNGKDIYLSRYGQSMQILLPISYKHKCGYIPNVLTRYFEYQKSVSHVSSYEKNVELLNGYKDIRVNVLKQMGVCDKKLLDKIEQFYLKQKLDLAIRMNKTKEIDVFYKQIKKTPKIRLMMLSNKRKGLKNLYIKLAKLIRRK